MKLHIFILCILFTASVPLYADNDTIETADKTLKAFSAGHNHGADCDHTHIAEVAEGIRNEVCPNFLATQMIERDSSLFGFLSADNTCDEYLSKSKNTTSTNPQELEHYLQNKPPFSKLNTTSISDCLSHPVHIPINKTSSTAKEKILPENKHNALIAEYYLTQHQLESGMSNTLQEITAIDQLIGNPNLSGIDCDKFQHSTNTLNECKSLQQCSPPRANLDQLTKETMDTMKAITAIDQEINRLNSEINRLNSMRQNKAINKVKIKDLQAEIKNFKERKAGLQSLYPWTTGRVFLKGEGWFGKGYSENSTKEEVKELIKKQMSYTKTRLEKNMNEMQQAFSCIRYNKECKDLDFDQVMAKTPAIDTENIFGNSSLDEMSPEEIRSMSADQKTSHLKNTIATNYFNLAQCRQGVREDASKFKTDLGFFALDVGLTIATVGLGAAAIAGRLAVRAGSNISKAQRLQNLGLMGIDVAFSAPHINRAIDKCDGYMNQLERLAGEKADNVCSKLPVRSKLTSDLKSCLLTASLASLPIVVPGVAVAGRALAKKAGIVKGGGPSSPAPKDPAPTSPSGGLSNSPALPAPSALPKSTSPATAESKALALKTDSPPVGAVKNPSSSRTPETKALPAPRQQRSQTTNGSTRATDSAKTEVKALPAPSQRSSSSSRTARRGTDTTSSGAGSSTRRQGDAQTGQSRSNSLERGVQARQTQRTRSSQRANNRFHNLKDSENRARGLSKRIMQIIKRNDVTKPGKNSIGNYLAQARAHLKQENPRLSDDRISQIIVQELKQQGANIRYTKGNYRVQNNEGVFIVNANSGKISRVANKGQARSSTPRQANRQDLQPAGSAGRTQNTSRSTAVVLRSNNNRNVVPKRVNTPQTRSQKPNTRQHIASTGARTARQIDSPPGTKPDRLVPRSIRAGVAARNVAAGVAGAGVVGSTATDIGEEDSSSDTGDSSNNGDTNNDQNSGRDNSNDNSDNNEDSDKEKKKKEEDWDCSKYKGGNPQNRRETICYYYMKTAQLEAETKQIRQNTQALNQFKSQVWLGVKENQVPPSFFTNIQKNIQQNKGFTADYLSSFRLMYDISRIQDQYLAPNDRNRLRQILQDTGQYMNSPNLDGYSHIQESINILLNRLQLPINDRYFRL
ncbi:MAG: hypothetical protein OXK80_04260 [Bdellovibrionales bacterium]|nr:hypothetical protein [Bdellovibrionales bacterium]